MASWRGTTGTFSWNVPAGHYHANASNNYGSTVQRGHSVPGLGGLPVEQAAGYDIFFQVRNPAVVRIAIRVHGCDTVVALQKRIHEATNIAPGTQQLVFDRSPLTTGRLDSYGILPGALIEQRAAPPLTPRHVPLVPVIPSPRQAAPSVYASEIPPSW
jgi:hypothetical protein